MNNNDAYDVKNFLNRSKNTLDTLVILKLQENIELRERLNKIKKYLKKIYKEMKQGILSSDNLIWDNIERLCDGKEILDKNESN